MTIFKEILTAVRNNGRQHLHKGPAIRQLVFANMIWLATYTGFTLYTFITIFFIPVPLLPFIVFAVSCQICFISCFLLFRYNYLNTGKHCLILSTYLFLMIFDHMTQKETLIYLFMLAFLPTAMNIFSVRRNSISVILYTLCPLIYTLFTNLAIYQYPSFPALDRDSLIILIAFNITLSFTLFIMFGNYMVINNLARQQKLLLRSISLQTTLDNSIGAVWTIDKDYNLIATNTKYTESIEHEFGVIGLKAGINIRQLAIWEKLSEPLRAQYYSVLHGQDILHEIELNGKHFEIKGVPIYDPEGKIRGATFGSRDITAKKNAEETLLKAKKAAEDANMAKARFLSNMSHEIRTPLNGIIGITRIMQDEKFLPGQYENLKTLQDLSEHTLQIINNILDIAKIEAGKSFLENKRFNLQRFIRKMNSIFYVTSKLKGIKFIIETEGHTDIYIYGDEVRLSQILINLIGNAFKFTEKGNVTFKICSEENPDSGIQNLRFSVSDTGIGIKQENVGKIFENFSQADSETTRKFGGSGLGLSIVDNILRLMNSNINVDSKYGKGTTFWFDVSLKRSSITPLNKTMTPSAHDKYSLPNINILLAEDNKINQIVATRILQKWESKVTVASNGKEAVDSIEENKFDLILMDLDMPVMDGYESLTIIKQNFPDIPVIALTASSFDDMNNYLSKKGFSEVVQKPFTVEELYSKISSVLKRA